MTELSSPQGKKFLSASDVAEILGISKSSAYRIIKKLNGELQKSGKISSRYFYEKIYL
jgi:Mga helix-turn-helix domain.